MEIPTDSLHNLPTGAVYTAKQGQASVKVSRENKGGKETIYVYASCDSLQLQCEEYERRIEALRKGLIKADTGTSVQVEQKSNGIQIAIEWLIAGIIAGGVIVIVVITKIKKK